MSTKTRQTEDSGGISDRLRSSLAFCWAEAVAAVASSDSNRGALTKGLARNNRGQTNLTQLVIGIMIAGIVIMQVFVPVINDAASNLSGTEGTIADLLPLFAVLMLLVALASPLMSRI